MELFEALYTTRAMRRVTTDPVPDDVIAAMIDAAIRAPTGSNRQDWRWITVTDRDTLAEIAPLYREAWDELQNTLYKGQKAAAQQRGDSSTLRVFSSSEWLVENFQHVPLVVFVYHRNDPTGASIYPAVWNLMLAARSFGVGTTLTTVLGFFKHDEVAEVLGVPLEKGWMNAAAITCGYPLGRWGVAERGPAHDVAYAETWGAAPSWRVDEPLWHPAD